MRASGELGWVGRVVWRLVVFMSTDLRISALTATPKSSYTYPSMRGGSELGVGMMAAAMMRAWIRSHLPERCAAGRSPAKRTEWLLSLGAARSRSTRAVLAASWSMTSIEPPAPEYLSGGDGRGGGGRDAAQ